MANPNPKNKFQKGDKRAGRPPGVANTLTRDIKSLIREAMEETGYIERVAVLDAEGKPTGQTELKYGKDGEKGYFNWLARNHPGHFTILIGKLIPLEIDAKVEEKPIVRYETVEERRKAMIAAGWSPQVLAQLEEAMEPKFLRDMREREEARGAVVDGEVIDAERKDDA
jgi:hypothetical protein